nr:Imm74 family immunity protein [uncultured Caldimonas sp.]
MELVEISRGHLRVKDGARSVTIYGEALLRGHGSPDFVLYQNSIGKWDAPNDNEDISSDQKERILRYLQEEFPRRSMVLEIE